MRIAFFTAGTIGAGHLAHGLSILRGLRRRGFAGTYRMFGPEPPVPLRPEGYEVVSIDPAELRSPERAPEGALARALTGFAPDLLLIDMFWAPLRHILPLPRCASWLLLRAAPPDWLQGPPGMPFLPAQHRRIVAIEPIPSIGGYALADRIDPIVICNPEECRPSGSLRARLGVPAEERLVVASHAGLPGECSQLGDVPGGRTHRFDLHAGALFPLAEWLGDADLILSGAGYNSFWEACWLGYAGRSRFFPFPRAIDDQGWRARCLGGHVMRRNGADVLAEQLLG